jgi:TPR repeat protein
MIRLYLPSFITILVLAVSAFANTNSSLSVQEGIEMYRSGDCRSALRILRPYALNGHCEAQYILGEIYATCECFRESRDSLAWYMLAAEQNHPEAILEVAWCYATGTGVRRDLGVAAEWYRRGAEIGLAEAQYTLASMYDAGEGVAQDGGKCIFWLRKAADLEYPAAQLQLGLRYADGKDVTKDTVQALQWFLRAAAHGKLEACLRLADMYSRGEGTEKNYVEAYYWASVCIFETSGLREEAEAIVQNVKCFLTDGQKEKMDVQVKKWLAKYGGSF